MQFEDTQQKSIEYIRCFHDVNEMVHIINTTINIQLILTMYVIGNVYMMDLLQLQCYAFLLNKLYIKNVVLQAVATKTHSQTNN